MSFETILQKSQQRQTNNYDVNKTRRIRIPDSNNGIYPSNEISFETASLTSQLGYVDFKNSYLEIPFLIELTATGAGFTSENMKNAVTLKNSCLDVIQSINLNYNDNNIINNIDMSHVPMNFKILSEFTQDKLNTTGALINFGGVNNSFAFSVASSTEGVGETNSMSTNDSLKKRQNTTNTSSTFGQNSLYTSDNLLQLKNKSYYKRIDANNHMYYMLLTIPLSYLSEFFEKVPIVRRPFLRLNIRFHSSTTVLNYNNTGTKMDITSVNTIYGYTPYMMSFSGATGIVGTADSVITIKSSVAGTNHNIKRCYLNMCLLELSPEKELSYMKMNNNYKIIWNNFTYKKFTAQTSSINLMIQNSVSRARGLLIKLQATHNGVNPSTASAIAGFNVNTSPFSSSNTIPYGTISNMNVIISGIPIKPQNFDFTYQLYLDMLSQLSVNGNDDLITSGLITETDFNLNYHYIYIPLLFSEQEDVELKQIELVGTISSLVPCDVSTYLFYEKELNIDCYTSQPVV